MTSDERNAIASFCSGVFVIWALAAAVVLIAEACQ